MSGYLPSWSSKIGPCKIHFARGSKAIILLAAVERLDRGSGSAGGHAGRISIPPRNRTDNAIRHTPEGASAQAAWRKRRPGGGGEQGEGLSVRMTFKV